MHGSIQPYGGTAQAREVRFRTFPNPGGAPLVGSSTFSLTLETTVNAASGATSLFLLGAQPLRVPLLNSTLLVNPAIVVGVSTPTPSTSVTVPLPIPAGAPKGAVAFAQWVICAAGACRASRGIKIVTR